MTVKVGPSILLAFLVFAYLGIVNVGGVYLFAK